MDEVVRVVRRLGLQQEERPSSYWRTRPAAERIAAVTRLRREHHGWTDAAPPEIQRVCRVVRATR